MRPLSWYDPVPTPTCDDTVTLGVEDEAVCERPRGHDGDHMATWTTSGSLPRVAVEIRWREVIE